MPQTEQITRHICVEGWSAIGRWGGVRFSDFLDRVGADTTAKYVGFQCADDYYTSIDMPTALHPQTLLTLTYDGRTLPAEYGFPMKLRMPTKLGYKNPKHILAMFVTNALSRAAIGKTRATTGSAAADAARPLSCAASNPTAARCSRPTSRSASSTATRPASSSIRSTSICCREAMEDFMAAAGQAAARADRGAARLADRASSTSTSCG